MLCSSVNELQQISNASSKEDYIPQALTQCFVRDSLCLHLTFVAFGLLSVICKQWLKQCNYSVDQSALLTGFRTYFTSSVSNFCCWVADVPPREMSPAAKSEEKRMFSQANIFKAWIQWSVFTWRHGGRIGVPKQWTSSHVGVPNQSCGSWTPFLCKRFLLFQKICIDAGHVSENTLY